MPETRFRVVWPDGTRDSCYSPSLVVKDAFEAGRSYPIEGFVAAAREALAIGSERVRARYGFPCSRALAQIRAIEATAARQPAGAVLVEGFEE